MVRIRPLRRSLPPKEKQTSREGRYLFTDQMRLYSPHTDETHADMLSHGFCVLPDRKASFFLRMGRMLVASMLTLDICRHAYAQQSKDRFTFLEVYIKMPSRQCLLTVVVPPASEECGYQIYSPHFGLKSKVKQKL